jgi:hypothetical protein
MGPDQGLLLVAPAMKYAVKARSVRTPPQMAPTHRLMKARSKVRGGRDIASGMMALSM